MNEGETFFLANYQNICPVDWKIWQIYDVFIEFNAIQKDRLSNILVQNSFG